MVSVVRRLVDVIFKGEPLSPRGVSVTVLILRVFAGAMMIPYGIGKIEGFEQYSENFFEDPIGIGMVPSLVLTIFAQVVCSSALVLGLFTRAAAIVLAFNMLVASRYHLFDDFDDFATLSLPLLFLGIYVVLILFGGGRYSVDHAIFGRKADK